MSEAQIDQIISIVEGIIAFVGFGLVICFLMKKIEQKEVEDEDPDRR